MVFRIVPTFASVAILQAMIFACLPHTNDAVTAQEVRATVGSRTVYLGESFIYQLHVSDVDEPVPQAPRARNARIEAIAGPTQQQSILSINGRTVRTTTTTFSWQITPLTAGRMTIPASTVKSGDKTLKSQPVQVNVVAPSESDLFSLSARVDRERIYPRQRFAIEFNVEMRRLPEPFSDVSPVSSRVLRNSPALRVPWFEDSRIPDGLAPLQPLDTRPWRTVDGSGFTLNGLRQFGFLTMLPKAEVVNEDKEPQRIRYTFKRQFAAERAGRFELGMASLRGSLVDTIENDRATLKDIYGVTEPVIVNIEPLPLDSRPDSWIGVIGDLDVRSEITPKVGRVGQPMTMTLTLTGTGAMVDAFPPKLSDNDAITNQFRVYEPTSRLTGSSRIFNYSVRPRQAGDIVFPPIELTWFDPLREEYVTGRTSEIPLRIAEGNALANKEIQSPAENSTAEPMVATTPGITANLPQLTDDGIRPRHWFITWATIAAVTVVLCLATGRNASQAARLAKIRTERFLSAETELARAIGQLRSGDRDAGITGIRTAVNRIAAAASDSSDEGLTTAEVSDRLSGSAFESDLVTATHTLLEDCDAARYGAASDNLEDLQDAAQRTVGDLLHAARGMRFNA